MKIFKMTLILLLFLISTKVCYTQENKHAYINTKAFYISENGITQLVDALKALFPDFPKLNAKEKNKKFERIYKKCKESKTKSRDLDTKEEDVCIVINDIDESLKEFRRNHGFATLINVSVCKRGFPCPDGIDITEQFVKEYKSTKK